MGDINNSIVGYNVQQGSRCKGSIRKLKKEIKKEKSYRKVNSTVLNALKFLAKDSNIVNRALYEMSLVGMGPDAEEGPNKWMRDSAIELISLLQLFASQGHSGFSASYCISAFTKLANFENLSPLTLKDDEFKDDHFEKGSSQNKRKSSIFKNSKGIYDINAFVKNAVSRKPFGKTEIIKGSFGTWSGSLLESDNGVATGRAFRRCYFKEVDINQQRLPVGNFKMPCLEVEVQPDDWLMFVDINEPKYKELQECYDIEYIDVPNIKGLDVLKLTKNYGY